MKLKLLAGALLGAGMIAAAPANAATLSINGGVAGVLPNNFNPPEPVGFSVGDPITIFQAAVDDGPIGGGLEVTPVGPAAAIRVTFLGSEAGRNNSFIELSGTSGTLNNKTSTIGDFVDFDDMGDFVDFLFRANAETITNGGISTDAAMSIGFSNIFTGPNGRDAVVAFFGDGFGDSDFDDLVVGIQVIPLPAGLVLLLTALGGLGFVARRRRQGATA